MRLGVRSPSAHPAIAKTKAGIVLANVAPRSPHGPYYHDYGPSRFDGPPHRSCADASWHSSSRSKQRVGPSFPTK